MIFLSLLNNIALLVALSVIHSIIVRRWKTDTTVPRMISGLLFGSVAVVGMATPVRLLPGIIFDGRSIVISVAGLFGGPIAGAIAAGIAAGYRLWLGGAGTIVGVCVILEAAGIGIAYHYLRRRRPRWVTPWHLLGFGILVHLVMLALLLRLPGGVSRDVFRQIAGPVITLYPVATLLMCMLFLDQESRLRAEEALRESEARWQFALEGAGDGVWDWDVPTGKVFYSHRLKAMLGYADDEIGDTLDEWHKRIHPEDREHVYAELRRHFDGDAPVYVSEHRLLCKDGTYKWILDRGKIITRTPDGRPKRAIGTHSDITDRKRQEEELRRKNEEMERFAYTASHDLKSPLVTIQGFLGKLRKDLEDGDRSQVDVDLRFMENAAAKMGGLLEELLELSRIGRKVNPPEDASLQDLAREAIELVAGRIAERGVSVRVTDTPYVLHGDRPRLREVFQNLIDNAVKFMGDQPAPQVEIGVEERNGAPVLFVRDNGMGIDPRHQQRLFGLFEKLNPEIEGTGMGLAIVKRIVELHGGRIWLESAGPGQGTTFFFTLAKTRPTPAAAGIVHAQRDSEPCCA